MKRFGWLYQRTDDNQRVISKHDSTDIAAVTREAMDRVQWGETNAIEIFEIIPVARVTRGDADVLPLRPPEQNIG